MAVGKVGRPAVQRAIVHTIQTLLRRKWSKAAAARETGVSDRTVYRVANGTHVSLRGGALRRCECGALLLVVPCKACEIRATRGVRP
jgi:hypothetical protein